MRDRETMKLKILISFILLTWSLVTMAQQDPQISQYMFNNATINPAAVGTNDGNVTVFYRTQWVNQPGAPKTMGFVGDLIIPNTNVAVGLNAFKTSQGPLSFTRLQTNYSYKIKLKEDVSTLFLGLQAGIVQYSINAGELKLHDDISLDQTFNNGTLQKTIPDFGFGSFVKVNNFYFGASIPHLLQSKIKFVNDMVDTTGRIGPRNSFTKIFRHYYFTGGTSIYINPRITLQPSFLIKVIANAPVTADVNLIATIKENFWAGAGYRISNPGAFIAMAGVTFKMLKFGYSYDITRGPLAAYSGATHELMVNYKFQIVKEVKVSKKPYFLK